MADGGMAEVRGRRTAAVQTPGRSAAASRPTLPGPIGGGREANPGFERSAAACRAGAPRNDVSRWRYRASRSSGALRRRRLGRRSFRRRARRRCRFALPRPLAGARACPRLAPPLGSPPLGPALRAPPLRRGRLALALSLLLLPLLLRRR